VLGPGYRPGKSAVLVRNPNWRSSTDFRPAYLDRIDIKIGGDAARIGHDVLAGSDLVQNTPPTDIVQFAHERSPSQLELSPSAGVEFIALNNKQGPFSDGDVRKAFWAALDRLALNRASGHEYTAALATHFLYPGMPGYSNAVFYLSARKLSYNEHPAGDIAIAEQYLHHAGYSTGRYTGHHILRVVGIAGEHSARAAAVAIATLRSLGFRTSLRLVSKSDMYSAYCGVPAKEIDVCLNARPHVDFADGQQVLHPTFYGHTIRAMQNENWGQVNTFDINSAIARESRIIDNKERAHGFGAVDNGLVGQGVAIPYAWLSEPAIESRDVVGVGDLWNAGAWDYSFTSLR
jgi:peptide/nickel transport system substrate-binding protein